MPKKKTPQKSKQTHNRAAKKAVVTRSTRKSPLPLLLLFVGILTIGGGVYYFTQMNDDASFSAAQATQTAAVTDSTQVAYPVSTFDDGTAHHYEYAADGMTIKYFILKSHDGVIRAAFDACDVCWPSGKGYYQEGDEMVCRNCGRRFASHKINEVKGGCNPAPLNRRVEGDQLVINVADIIEGKTYFDFSKGQRS